MTILIIWLLGIAGFYWAFNQAEKQEGKQVNFTYKEILSILWPLTVIGLIYIHIKGKDDGGESE
jgi:hypothetical protein